MKYFVLLACAIVGTVRCDGHWNYLNQEEWKHSYPSCGGRSQSPIDIKDVCLPNSGVRVNESLRVNLINYETHPRAGFVLTNNGHSAQLSLNGGTEHSESAPKLTGPAVDNQVYQFAQLHFHWDQNDTEGSEHSIHGRRKALEMHLVHWNVKYENFNEASSQPDGLVVFTVLFQAGLPENKLLNPIVDKLPGVFAFDSKVDVDPSTLTLKSLLPHEYQTFYRYQGSLTTPPCSESVTWLIVAQPENIAYSQLREFARLDNQENKALGDTNRELQPINHRIVEASSNRHCSRSTNRAPEIPRRPFGRNRLQVPTIPPELHHPDAGVRARIEQWLHQWM